MQHKTIRLTAVLVLLALLCVPVSAAALQTDWDEPCVFTGTEFIPADADPVNGIFITDVPAAADGVFRYGSRVLNAGDVLPAGALSQITLQPNAQRDMELCIAYQPICGRTLAQPAVLTVQVEDGKCPPPEAKDSSFETYKNIPNNGVLDITGGAAGEMTFTVTKEPRRGTVTINPDGTFLYTPNKNKVGSDKFTYTVTDAAGGTSNEATVSVEIKKPVDAAVYADMTGDEAQFEAMWLAGTGLYTGKSLSGQACFEPEAGLTRGEFLTMVMQLADITPEADTAGCGFADLNQAPAWVQPYLAQAQRCGIVRGMRTDSGLVFRPNDPVTGAQAAVMVQNLLQLPLPETAEVLAKPATVPAWAETAALALEHAGLGLDCADFDQPLTRRQAANLLYHASRQV